MIHKAKKQFGQNFLKDEAIKNQIIQAIPEGIKTACSKQDSSVQLVEIGPGLGDLTEKLLSANLYVKSLEIDRDLPAILREKFADQIAAKRWELELCDALEWRSDKEYFIAANLPYNVSAPLIIKALADPLCLGQLVMVQFEMAQRVLNIDAGPLGVLTRTQCAECELICTVPPSAFEPAPKVQSAVVLLRRSENALDASTALKFAAFLKMMFASPRKQLKAAIKHDSRLTAIASELDLLSLRPAQISVSSFLEIFKRMNDGRAK